MTRRADRPLKVKVKSAKGRTPSQKHWLERQLNDPFVRDAKRLGYRARSAFKLIEIADKYHLLRPGMRVVDLGGTRQLVASCRDPGACGRGRRLCRRHGCTWNGSRAGSHGSQGRFS